MRPQIRFASMLSVGDLPVRMLPILNAFIRAGWWVGCFLLFTATGLASGRWQNGLWFFQEGVMEVSIDAAKSGQIVRWVVDKKVLIQNELPTGPISLISADGAVWSFESTSFTELQGMQPGVEILGRLVSPGRPPIPLTLTYRFQEWGREIDVNLTVPQPVTLAVRKFGWTLPLALQPRKRVFYESDFGLEWDTRYFYQLTWDPAAPASQSLLRPPERNEWRFFGLDQLSPQAYRLWKAEGEGTAPVVMHEGRTPAAIVQVYDEQGGVTVDYPALRHAGGKSLRVDAAKGGTVEILFQSDNGPGRGAAATELSTQSFSLTGHISEREAIRDRLNFDARYKSEFSMRPALEKILLEPDWVVRAPLTGKFNYVTGGYPFGRGELKSVSALSVQVANRVVPIQSKPLAYWPDGSVKWALLTFPFSADTSVENGGVPGITLRNGQGIPLKIEQADARVVPASKLTVAKSKTGEVTVTNGDLVVTVGAGENWLRQVLWRGKVVVDAASDSTRATAYCEYRLSPKRVPAFGMPEGGTTDRGALRVDSVQVEESGPLRSVVRLEGVTTNREPTRIILRLEFLAGRPELRLTHSAVFRFKDPRRTFLTGMGVDLPLTGGQRGGRVRVIQSSVRQRDGWVGDRRMDSAPPGWVRVKTATGGVTAVIRNFEELAPKGLVADFKKGRLRMELWPQEAGAMDVRRYSGVLHRAQSESPVTGMENQGAAGEDWAAKFYYAREPFYGISRTHEMLLAFDDGTLTDGGAESLAADFQSPPLLYAGWDRYASTQVVLPASDNALCPQAWIAWTRLARFFLYHRTLHNWSGFWNYGDSQQRFHSGSGWRHTAPILQGMLDGSLSGDEAKIRSGRTLDYVPANNWASDNGAFAWANGVGQPGLFLQQEYLRHGNRVIYFAAEAMGRYARDVVTRQEGAWMGMGTRGGVQPWSDGSHEERLANPAEYRLLYFLSGDGRSREVVDRLYRTVSTKGQVKDRGTHSVRLSTLLFHWEMTGAKDEGTLLQKYVRLFLGPRGIFIEPTVRFPEMVAAAKPEMLNSGSLFFHADGGMRALLDYQQITGDKTLSAAIVRMAEAIQKRPVVDRDIVDVGDFPWAPVAFAARYASEPESYRQFLASYIEKGGWKNIYMPVPRDATKWSGPTAYMYRSVLLTLFWANWAPYITGAIGEREPWSPEIAQEFGAMDDLVLPVRRASWQSDWDVIPSLEAYLAPQQPWHQ